MGKVCPNSMLHQMGLLFISNFLESKGFSLIGKLHFFPELFGAFVFGVERIFFRFKIIRKWLVKRHQEQLRLSYFEEYTKELGDGRVLNRYEFGVFSQNCEDGILNEIFQRIGVESRYFVEFGIQDGTENCTRNLLVNHGWSGVWIDGSIDYVDSARSKFSRNKVRILESLLTRENILDVFNSNDIPNEFDLCVIDVDGNDYWLWEKISENYRPRVVVIEVNASLPVSARWVMPYDPNHSWDGTNYFGASLRSLAELAERLGYVIVGCDHKGVNAFFIRRDLVVSALFFRPGDWRFHFRYPKYHPHFAGHPRIAGLPHEDRNKCMPLLRPDEMLNIGVELRGKMHSACQVSQRFRVWVEVTNRAGEALTSIGSNAVFLSYRWRRDEGYRASDLVDEGVRTILPGAIGPRSSCVLPLEIKAPAAPGLWQLVISPVQEGNMWFVDNSGQKLPENCLSVNKVEQI